MKPIIVKKEFQDHPLKDPEEERVAQHNHRQEKIKKAFLIATVNSNDSITLLGLDRNTFEFKMGYHPSAVSPEQISSQGRIPILVSQKKSKAYKFTIYQTDLTKKMIQKIKRITSRTLQLNLKN